MYDCERDMKFDKAVEELERDDESVLLLPNGGEEAVLPRYPFRKVAQAPEEAD